MRRLNFLLVLGATLLLSLPRAAASTPPSRYCAVYVIPDYQLVVSYRAILGLETGCPPGGAARIRKASTLNRTGPYRPIKPDGSARYGGLWGWTLTERGGNVPERELWTSFSWEWEWWDGRTWRPARRP